MEIRLITGAALALGLMSLAPAARATPITAAEILSSFNAVVLGNFSSNSDVEGRILVGGDLTGGATFKAGIIHMAAPCKTPAWIRLAGVPRSPTWSSTPRNAPQAVP